MKTSDSIVKAAGGKLPKIAKYAELLRRVRETLILGQKRIDALRVETYWQTGRDINEHVRLNGGRAEYGKKVLLKLSGDTGTHESVLRRCAEFAEKFPENPIRAGRHELPAEARQIEKSFPKSSLTWSHYRSLITVADDRTRFELARRAEKHAWNSPELARVIGRYKTKWRALAAPELLTPKKGSLYHYRIFRSTYLHDEGELKLDLGFSVRKKLSLVKHPRGLEAGELVESVPQGKTYRLVKPEGKTEADLWTYRAWVIRVVDGDTLFVEVDLGFGDTVEQYLRLRGIDSPEMDTKEGKEARAFVVRELKDVPFILLQSSRSDQWDRYLADVFYTAAGKERFLNNRLLESGHAVRTDY